ncbi:ATP-dependent 3'-5' DNA helicase [Conoideocrella luteorostrata]|uniref:ATP-dependent 3'-5' DNA helicase n=1 Tax=Conoideocrella luteorostrata TaxID=1105319 RepID=A0AAJ0FSH8_9HYPO|nr:ATP-dependent 3'-5' DNA helicase [Conoideocrella luteorostrata]
MNSDHSRDLRNTSGKRKQPINEHNGSAQNTDIAAESQKPKQIKKCERSEPPAKKKHHQSTPCLIEWPDLFMSLDRTHQALNLVFTFCCTRKHLATTFETIKSAVEVHTKQPLTEDEVALIVALRPEGINFTYVDTLMLQLDAKGSERDDTFKSSNSSRSQAPAHDASVGGWTGHESLDEHQNRELGSGVREVLFFEFVDGDLKRKVQDKKTGEAVKPNRKLRDEKLKIPIYGQKQMTQLIGRRNEKFKDAINGFLNRCVENKLDPEITLKHMAQPFLPKPSAGEDVAEFAPSVPENIPKERKSIPEIVQELKDSSWYTGQVVPDGHRVFEPEEPIFGDLTFLLSQNLINALYNAKGITKFYAHQAGALNRLHEGQNVVVATSTSSGKSLIYQLPVLRALETDSQSRAMYIFPTKALAQDQKRSLKDMITYMPGLEDVLVETFDGDTPISERNAIREEARIIFTNPDMLHVTILPQEEKWRSFLKNLHYVVGLYCPVDFDYEDVS